MFRDFKMNALIIGNLTIDINITETGIYNGVGGSSFFCGKILSGLGAKVEIASPRGEDFPDEMLKGMTLHPAKPVTKNTLTFKNIINNKSRRQIVLHAADAGTFKARDIPDSNCDTVLVTPLIDNMDKAFHLCVKDKFPRALRVLLPQGLFRKIGDNGQVTRKNWNDAKNISALYKIIVFSREDVQDADAFAQNLSKGETIAVVTKDKDGCTVFVNGKKTDFPAFKAKSIIDSTGAGDIFAAALAYDYFRYSDPYSSCKYANKIASQSLQFLPNELDSML